MSTSVSQVPTSKKIIFGLASPVDTWAVWLPLVMASPVLTLQLKIDPWVVSTLFTAFRFWDAITDPVMGWISDNTRTRWGRRRPYIFVGAILTGVFYPLIWMFPRDASHTLIIVWMSVGGVLLYTAFTIWSMPYQSFFMEMTPDYHERTRINSYRFFFGTLFAFLLAWCWNLTQWPIFNGPDGTPDTLLGTRWLTLGAGAIMMVFGMLPALFLRERFGQATSVVVHKKTSLREDVRLTLSNRSFLILVFVTLTFAGGTSLVNNFGIFIGTYYVLGGDQVSTSWWSGLGSTMYSIATFVAILLVNWISPKIGKTRTMAYGLAAQLIGAVMGYFLTIPGYPALGIFTAFFNGLGVQGTWLLVGSMVADIADEDELQTGSRREGSYSSVFSWVVKMSFTVGFGLSGYLVELTGFDVERGVDQLDVLQTMRFLSAAIPTVFLVLALLLLRRYKITAETAAATRAALEARRGAV